MLNWTAAVEGHFVWHWPPSGNLFPAIARLCPSQSPFRSNGPTFGRGRQWKMCGAKSVNYLNKMFEKNHVSQFFTVCISQINWWCDRVSDNVIHERCTGSARITQPKDLKNNKFGGNGNIQPTWIGAGLNANISFRAPFVYPFIF